MKSLAGFELVGFKASGIRSKIPGDLIFSHIFYDGKHHMHLYFSEAFAKEMRMRKGDRVEVLYNANREQYALRLGDNGRTVSSSGSVRLRIVMPPIGYAAEFRKVSYNLQDIDIHDGIAIVGRTFHARLEELEVKQ